MIASAGPEHQGKDVSAAYVEELILIYFGDRRFRNNEWLMSGRGLS
jgi:hypothetical protein